MPSRSGISACCAVRASSAWPLLLLVPALLPAACGDASGQEHRLLFPEPESRLPAAAMAEIFADFSSGLGVSADGSGLEDPYCGDLDVETEVVDLNGDGRFEVFIAWGNPCTSGMTGRSLSLYLDHDGRGYKQQLGFPAMGWRALEPGAQGWPDLLIGGPGFCQPVWTWRENAYEFKCGLPETPDGCTHADTVCHEQ